MSKLNIGIPVILRRRQSWKDPDERFLPRSLSGVIGPTYGPRGLSRARSAIYNQITHDRARGLMLECSRVSICAKYYLLFLGWCYTRSFIISNSLCHFCSFSLRCFRCFLPFTVEDSIWSRIPFVWLCYVTIWVFKATVTITCSV